MVRRFSTLLLSGRLVDFLLHHFVAAHGSRIVPEGALTFDADMTPGMEGELHSGKVKSFNNVPVRQIFVATHTPATFFFIGIGRRSIRGQPVRSPATRCSSGRP